MFNNNFVDGKVNTSIYTGTHMDVLS